MGEAANGLRSLVVEAGHHNIVTRFLPRSFFVGVTVTLLSWIFVAVWIVRALIRAHGRRAAPAPAPE